jgi:hypothetical protein
MVSKTVQVLEFVTNCAANLRVKVSGGSTCFEFQTDHVAFLATIATFTVDDGCFINYFVISDYIWRPGVQTQRKMLLVECFKLCSRIDHRTMLNSLFRGLARVARLCSLNIGILRRWRKLYL